MLPFLYDIWDVMTSGKHGVLCVRVRYGRPYVAERDPSIEI